MTQLYFFYFDARTCCAVVLAMLHTISSNGTRHNLYKVSSLHHEQQQQRERALMYAPPHRERRRIIRGGGADHQVHEVSWLLIGLPGMPFGQIIYGSSGQGNE